MALAWAMGNLTKDAKVTPQRHSPLLVAIPSRILQLPTTFNIFSWNPQPTLIPTPITSDSTVIAASRLQALVLLTLFMTMSTGPHSPLHSRKTAKHLIANSNL
jgi:hypothetical protein